MRLRQVWMDNALILDEADKIIPYIWVRKSINPQPFYVYVYVSDVFGRLIDITSILAEDLRMSLSSAKATPNSLIVHSSAYDKASTLVVILNASYKENLFSDYYRTVRERDVTLRSFDNQTVLSPHKDFEPTLWKCSWNSFKSFVKDTATAEELFDRLYRRDVYAPSMQLFGSVYYTTKQALVKMPKG